MRTPHLARENLYLTSGHLPYYAESMFPPMILENERGATTNVASAKGSASGRVGVPPAVPGVSPGTSESTTGARYEKEHRRLPHFEKPWAIYFVTVSTRNRRVLSPESRTIVLNALRHFHGVRYELFAAVVMPDHIHFLLQPWVKEKNEKDESVFWPLGDLMHSIKSFTAKEINKTEGTTGAVWEQERYDRYVRGDSDLEEKFLYICNNPRGENLVGPEENYPWIWTPDAQADVRPTPGVPGGTPGTAGGTPTLPEARNLVNDAAAMSEARLSANDAPSFTMSTGDRYYLKAMNCPHHHKLFGAVPRSYRDIRCGSPNTAPATATSRAANFLASCACAPCR